MRSVKLTVAVMLLVSSVGCGGGGSNDPDEADADGVGGAGDTGDTGEGAGSRMGRESSGAGAGSGSGVGTPNGQPPSAVDCTHVGAGTDYQVGPGKAYENLGDVPFESLVAGDTVRVFWRDQPYREKLMIGGVGTAEQPIRVCGVAGPNGELPILDGENATTRPTLDFPYEGHQPRGVIIVGHPHAAPYDQQTSHVVIEALEVRNASPEKTFTDVLGQTQNYILVGAGIFVQRADDVTIRGCNIHDNNNGIFMGTGGGTEMSNRVLIEGNHIHNNGSLTDYYHHNVYNEVNGVIYQFNRFGNPRAGAEGVVLGANIKERSAGVVIRYNWIEDGAHLVDLVDAQEAKLSTVSMPSFHETFIYGNVMIRNGASGSMIHYGGDSGLFQDYRKGTLHFYENTVVVNNSTFASFDTAEVFEISTNEETLQATNNIFWSTVTPAADAPIAMLGERDAVTAGVATFTNNWVRDGWSPHEPFGATSILAQIAGLDGSLRGTDPGFTDGASQSFAPAAGSMVIGAGTDMSSMVSADLSVGFEYVPHQQGKPRSPESPPTIGAMAPAQ
jgi:parallel beta-helix repeat protein